MILWLFFYCKGFFSLFLNIVEPAHLSMDCKETYSNFLAMQSSQLHYVTDPPSSHYCHNLWASMVEYSLFIIETFLTKFTSMMNVRYKVLSSFQIKKVQSIVIFKQITKFYSNVIKKALLEKYCCKFHGEVKSVHDKDSSSTLILADRIEESMNWNLLNNTVEPLIPALDFLVPALFSHFLKGNSNSFPRLRRQTTIRTSFIHASLPVPSNATYK